MTANELKALFQIGTEPNQDAFWALIDAVFNEMASSDVEKITIDVSPSTNTIAIPAAGVYELTGTAATVTTITLTADMFYTFVLKNGTTDPIAFTAGTIIQTPFTLKSGGWATGYVLDGEVSFIFEPNVPTNEFLKNFTDDETYTIEMKSDLTVIDVEIVSGGNFYAAKVMGAPAGAEVVWSQGAVFDTADTDGKFCVYWSGNDMKIRNRLGAVAKTIVKIKNVE